MAPGQLSCLHRTLPQTLPHSQILCASAAPPRAWWYGDSFLADGTCSLSECPHAGPLFPPCNCRVSGSGLAEAASMLAWSDPWYPSNKMRAWLVDIGVLFQRGAWSDAYMEETDRASGVPGNSSFGPISYLCHHLIIRICQGRRTIETQDETERERQPDPSERN